MTDPQQPGSDPTWQQPGQPSSGQPQPGQPSFDQPSYGQPSYGQPSYGQPQASQPDYQQPQYDQPDYQQPQYGQPDYQQPQYGQPDYQQPAYQQHQYLQPQYGQPAYGQPVYAARPTNGMAIAALVCSLAGLAVGITAPVGAILGHIARRQIAQTGEQGDGMALAGIIVGWVITGLFVCGCVAYFGFIASLVGAGVVNT